MKPIKTDQDYKNALAEIDRLFDSEPDTPDGDMLDMWCALVESYERKHDDVKMTKITRGQALWNEANERSRFIPVSDVPLLYDNIAEAVDDALYVLYKGEMYPVEEYNALTAYLESRVNKADIA